MQDKNTFTRRFQTWEDFHSWPRNEKLVEEHKSCCWVEADTPEAFELLVANCEMNKVYNEMMEGEHHGG